MLYKYYIIYVVLVSHVLVLVEREHTHTHANSDTVAVKSYEDPHRAVAPPMSADEQRRDCGHMNRRCGDRHHRVRAPHDYCEMMCEHVDEDEDVMG